jgi:hypothetical protein
MKRLATLIAGLALLTAACGSGSAGSLGAAPTGPGSPAAPGPAGTAAGSPAASSGGAPSGPAGPGPSAETSAPAAAGTVNLAIWLLRSGKLFETQRSKPYSQAVGQAALAAMLAGPNQAERAAGLQSAIPSGTRLLGLKIAAGTATVDLSSAFESAATAPAMARRLAQVVYTATQFPTVTSVRLKIEGQARTVIGGVPVQASQTRAMYSSYLPAITVTSPFIGQQVSNPVTVSGTADVFEAVVSVRVLNAAGAEIARTFTTASCGTGCRGNYSATVSYSVSSKQPGTIEVFETSAKDGSPVQVQTIPVTLVP